MSRADQASRMDRSGQLRRPWHGSPAMLTVYSNIASCLCRVQRPHVHRDLAGRRRDDRPSSRVPCKIWRRGGRSLPGCARPGCDAILVPFAIEWAQRGGSVALPDPGDPMRGCMAIACANSDPVSALTDAALCCRSGWVSLVRARPPRHARPALVLRTTWRHRGVRVQHQSGG